MRRFVIAIIAGTVGLILVGCGAFDHTQKIEKVYTYHIEPNAHSAVTPVPRSEEWWMPRHQAVIDRVRQGDVDLIFIGDSITHIWEFEGKEVWQQYYGHRKAVNMGFGGDQTQHVLWRLNNGEIAGISPKLAIIMIGTNNSNGNLNSAKEIGEGIIAICQKLRKELPDTKILILGIFPRGETPSAQREKNAEASELASSIADNKRIYYLNINDKFLQKDGMLSKDIMPDLLHLGAKGYQIEAEAIEPTVKKLMHKK
jgi:beta-glucosidase